MSQGRWWRRFGAAFAVALLTLGLPAWLLVAAVPRTPAPGGDEPPERLADTGLYADFAARRIAPDVLAFRPQYPLWTDGASKRRWIRLPAGSSIDASDVDAWRFPVGTQLWKEFSFGSAVETRYMELASDGGWRYATYVWDAEGADARRAPELGVRGACESRDGARHDIPGRLECVACHGGAPSEVLGFSALQLSSARDPLAPHAESPEPGSVDLATLVQRGWIRGLDPRFVAHPPRIVASSDLERAALGYLHGNCSSCHNSSGPLRSLELDLGYSLAHEDSPPPALRTTLDVPSRAGGETQPRLVRGAPERSLLWRRVTSRNPIVRMPPMGTHLVDEQAASLLAQWIGAEPEAARPVTARDPNLNVSPYLSRKD